MTVFVLNFPFMVQIKNTKKDTLFIPNFPAFGPGEVRECSQSEAEILLANPYLVMSESSTDAVVHGPKASTRKTQEKK